jgi:hypothetical protein
MNKPHSKPQRSFAHELNFERDQELLDFIKQEIKVEIASLY